jgi:purine nucleosidase
VRVIIDTDPGIDDALAILYLAAATQVEIVAVGSVHGNVPAPQGAANALCVLEHAGLDSVPVAVGARRPIAQGLRTAEFVHGHDGLAGHATPTTHQPVAESAAEQLVTLARRYPGELTLLALAPLTNIALACLIEPDLPDLLRSVVVMGGALGVPGNITPHAEANFWHDPEAADLVLAAGFDNLTLAGLDVTEQASPDPTWLASLANIDDPRARFASALLTHYADVYSTLFGHRACSLHDPLAAAIAVDPGLATYRELPVAVELGGTTTRGQLLADLRGMTDDDHVAGMIGADRRPVKIATTADIPMFLNRLLAALQPAALGHGRTW